MQTDGNDEANKRCLRLCERAWSSIRTVLIFEHLHHACQLCNSNALMYRSKREVICSMQYRSTELNEVSWSLKTREKIYFHLTTRNGWSKRTWASFLFHHCFGFSLLSNTSPPPTPPPKINVVTKLAQREIGVQYPSLDRVLSPMANHR